MIDVSLCSRGLKSIPGYSEVNLGAGFSSGVGGGRRTVREPTIYPSI